MAGRATALRNIAQGLEPDAAREVMEAAGELESLTAALGGLLNKPAPVEGLTWRDQWEAAWEKAGDAYAAATGKVPA